MHWRITAEAVDPTGEEYRQEFLFEKDLDGLTDGRVGRTFSTLVESILRNAPLCRLSVLTPKSLRRILQITDGITTSIFQTINSHAVEAIKDGSECITDSAVETRVPQFDTDAAFLMTALLPVTLPPLTGELLSSWISRHADFYGVTPLTCCVIACPKEHRQGQSIWL